MSFRAARPALRLAVSNRAAIPARRVVPSFQPIIFSFARHFSITPRRLGSGEGDAALSAALASEHKFELDSAKEAGSEVPEFLESFRSAGVWNIVDSPGSDTVKVVRKFGNETLTLKFQISELEDPSASENDPLDPETDPSLDPENLDQSTPYIVSSLLVTKSGQPGAMVVDLEAGEAGFEVTNVAMYEKALGESEGAEGDYQRGTKYLGPQFDHLDQTVQDAFDNFLVERGVDESLSSFVLQYCEYKEQKDYVSWLSEIKGFVDA